MGTIKALALLTLIAVVLVPRANAQPPSPVLQYYWVSPQEVWLWGLNSDLPHVKAIYNPVSQEWTITPEDKVERWQQTFKDVARSFQKDAQIETIQDKTLQKFVLVKLRNEYPKVTWAREFPPVAQIYILPGADSQKGPQVKILSKNSTQQASFYRAANKWGKNGSINLPPLFQVDDEPEELNQLFGIDVGSGSKNERWNLGWHNWIERMLLDPALEQFTYSSSDQQRWILKRVLNANERLSDYPKVLPATFQAIVPPDIAPIKTEGKPSDFPYKWVLIVVLLLALILPFAIPQSRRRLYAWVPNSSSNASKKLAVTPNTLNDLHQRALEFCKKRHEPDGVTHDLILSALESARKVYEEVAPAIVKEEEDQRTKILNEYRTELGVSGKSDEDVQRLIALGQKAEELSTTARRTPFPGKIVSRTGKQPEQSWSDEQWLAFYPNVVSAYESALKDAVTEKTGSESELSAQLKTHEAELNTLKATHASESEKKHRELQKKTQEQAGNIKSLESQLSQTQTALDGERTEVNRLNGQIADAETKVQAAQATMAKLNRKINQLEQVKELSVNLRTWLQGYHNKLLQEKTREIRTVSVLTSLVNFSVGQMCFGVVAGKDILIKASAYNVLKLIREFEQSGRPSSLLNAIESKIDNLVPNVKTDFGNDSLGGSTYDDQLFREFLNFVKIDTKHDLSPFYIDLDKNEQQKLVHVST
jgi:hypothetical protein